MTLVPAAEVTSPKFELKGKKIPERTPIQEITWGFSPELVDKLEKHNYANPYVVIVVGYEKVTTSYMETRSTHFIPTKVYVRKLDEPVPKELVEFSNPGTNIVLGFVVNVKDDDDSRTLKEWEKYPDELRIFPTRKGYEIANSWSYQKGAKIAFFRYETIVDEEHFAPEPSRFTRALVRQFFPRSEFDQCNFRRRFLISLALTPLVQSYGLIARLFTLLYVALFAVRVTNIGFLFAFNPHDFGHYGIDDSFWYYKANGLPRKNPLKWLAPPTFILLVAGVILPGLLVTLSVHTVGNGQHTRLTAFGPGEVLKWDAILDPFIVIIIVAYVLLWTRRGQAFRRSRHQRHIAAQAAAQANPTMVINKFALLRKQSESSSGVTPETVGYNTPYLAYRKVKTWVCKPFPKARI